MACLRVRAYCSEKKYYIEAEPIYQFITDLICILIGLLNLAYAWNTVMGRCMTYYYKL